MIGEPSMISDLPLQLLDDYNTYLRRTGHWRNLPFKRVRSLNPANIKAMKELVVWCKERELDPRAWLISLFAKKHWSFPPKFSELCSDTHVAYFQNKYPNAARNYFSNRVQRELEEDKKDQYDPSSDLTSTVENNKRYRLDRLGAQDCMDAMDTTLGYHPRSFVCARCPLAKPCEEQLQSRVPYDIVALRKGEITSEHARHLALLHHGDNS